MTILNLKTVDESTHCVQIMIAFNKHCQIAICIEVLCSTQELWTVLVSSSSTQSRNQSMRQEEYP